MIKKDYNLTNISDNLILVQEIINLYVDARMSLEQISIEKNLTKATVYKILKDNQIQLRQRNNR